MHRSSPSSSSAAPDAHERVVLELVGDRARVRVARADDGLGREREDHVHDRVLDVVEARRAGRADAADRALEQRVAGEQLASSTSRLSIPAVWPGVCSALTVRPPISTSSPGFRSPVVPGTRSSGWASTGRVRPALERLAELGDVVAVMVGEQDVGDVEAVLVRLGEQRLQRPARVDEEGVGARPGRDEVRVGQPAIAHGALDDHGHDGTLGRVMELIHTCYRIGEIDRSVAFYEALGFEERRRMPIREEAINVFMGLPGDGDRLELTYNHGVDSYELGTATTTSR